MRIKILVLFAALMLILAACSGAPAATQAPGVGVTGPTDAAGSGTGAGTVASPTTAAGGAGAGAAAGTCVSVPDPQAFVTAGQGVYEANCAGCHGAQGEGSGNFPPLANSANVAMEDPIGLVTRYFSVDAHPKTLNGDDIASVLSFVRGSFGNSAAVVCPDQVLENMPAQ